MSSVDVGDAKVYMSELLKTKYPKECDRLIHILDNHHIKYGFLKGTKDIWCRDYMPIQTSEKREHNGLGTARSDDDVVGRHVDVVLGIIFRQFLAVTEKTL